MSKRTTFSTGMNVWDIVNSVHAKYASAETIDLDEPNLSASELIKERSQKYRATPVAAAFVLENGTVADNSVWDAGDVSNQVPDELKPGDILPLKILAVEKGNVILDPGNYKVQFKCLQNLYRYKKLREFTPNYPVDCIVREVNKRYVTVDIFWPMIDRFISSRARNPWIQNVYTSADRLDEIPSVEVRDLVLVKGGYIGKAVIPTLSDWLGEDAVIPAFVPGSQIVLNTTSDFEQFEGKTVKTFITSWNKRPGGNGMSLVCSAKNLIKHRGNLRLIEMFKQWTEGSEEWTSLSELLLEGKVTGVINSQKRCGVFVEIPGLEITGMIHCKPDELVNYSAGDMVYVHLSGFDEDIFWNEAAKQYQHNEPYVIEHGALKQMNIKPVFKLA